MVSDHPLHSGEFRCRGGVSDPPTSQIMNFAPISECTLHLLNQGNRFKLFFAELPPSAT